MKNVLKIILFTVLVTAFYAYIGQMVPQKEVHPPKDREFRSDMTTEEMVDAGQEIVGGKGTCLGCHTIGADKPGRFPDLGGIGARAGKRRPGMTDVEYLAQSIYEPNTYIVEGYMPGMPPIHKPPIGLSDREILAVIAYLQSLGGTPTVTMATHLAYQTDLLDATSSASKTAPSKDAPPAASVTSETSVAAASAAGSRPVVPAPASASAAAMVPGEPQSPAIVPKDAKALMAANACLGCHRLDQPGKLVGPSLYDVGKRLKPQQIYESILEPDAVIARGYPKGLMASTLKATGFYDKATAKDIKAIAEYLSAQRGKR